MVYTPDPTNVTQPDDTVLAETASAEFRALKSYIAGWLHPITSNSSVTPAVGAQTFTLTSSANTFYNGEIVLVVSSGTPASYMYGQVTGWTPGNPTVTVNVANIGNAAGGAKTDWSIGPCGLIGATGAAGVQGPQGVQGPIGNTGATGPQGPAGVGTGAINNGVVGNIGIYSALNTLGDSGVSISTDGTMAANVDTLVATQKALVTYVNSKLSGVASSAATKNILIGGDFTTNPWQMGQTFNAFAGGYCADQWAYGSIATSYVANVTAAADAPTVAQAGVAASTSVKITVATAATGVGAGTQSNFYQPIEGSRFAFLGFGGAGAQSVTLSFWVKSSVTGTYSASLYNAAQTRSQPVNFTINAANTWEKKTITFSGDTAGAWVGNSTAQSASLMICLHAGSTYQGVNAAWNAGAYYGTAANSNNFITTLGATFQLALVQLEAGTVATAFENLSLSDVLRQCVRYFYRVSYATSTQANLGNGFARSTTQCQMVTPLIAPLRVSPTITFNGNTPAFNDGAGNFTITSAALSTIFSTTDSNVEWYGPITGATAYHPGSIFGSGSGPGSTDFIARM